MNFADMHRKTTSEVLNEDKEPVFWRFKKLYLRAVSRAAHKGKGQVNLKIKNPKNLPTSEVFNKLKTFFTSEGFKLFANTDATGQMYLSICWVY
jgi:hypothetical protein